MGRWKSGFDVRPCARPVWGGYCHLIVARLITVAAAGPGGDPAKSLFLAVVAAAAATSEPVAEHGMIYVTALHVAATEARGCLYIGIGGRSS